MKDFERRHFVCDELKVERREDKPPKIVGHAAVFNSLSEEMWGFRDKIDPGAFAKSIEAADIRA